MGLEWSGCFGVAFDPWAIAYFRASGELCVLQTLEAKHPGLVTSSRLKQRGRIGGEGGGNAELFGGTMRSPQHLASWATSEQKRRGEQKGEKSGGFGDSGDAEACVDTFDKGIIGVSAGGEHGIGAEIIGTTTEAATCADDGIVPFVDVATLVESTVIAGG